MRHLKKMIVPIIITILFLTYLTVYGILVMTAAEFEGAAVLLAIPLIALGAGMVWVLCERIREIRRGEDDDLDNY